MTALLSRINSFEDQSSVLLSLKKFFRHDPARASIVLKSYETAPVLSNEALNVITKVNNFRKLAENWDSYGASEISLNAIALAKKFIKEADEYNLRVYFAAPGPDGQVLIEFKNELREAEIFFNEDGTMECAVYEKNKLVKEKSGEVTVPDVLKWLQ